MLGRSAIFTALLALAAVSVFSFETAHSASRISSGEAFFSCHNFGGTAFLSGFGSSKSARIEHILLPGPFSMSTELPSQIDHIVVQTNPAQLTFTFTTNQLDHSNPRAYKPTQRSLSGQVSMVDDGDSREPKSKLSLTVDGKSILVKVSCVLMSACSYLSSEGSGIRDAINKAPETVARRLSDRLQGDIQALNFIKAIVDHKDFWTDVAKKDQQVIDQDNLNIKNPQPFVDEEIRRLQASLDQIQANSKELHCK